MEFNTDAFESTTPVFFSSAIFFFFSVVKFLQHHISSSFLSFQLDSSSSKERKNSRTMQCNDDNNWRSREGFVSSEIKRKPPKVEGGKAPHALIANTNTNLFHFSPQMAWKKNRKLVGKLFKMQKLDKFPFTILVTLL